MTWHWHRGLGFGDRIGEPCEQLRTALPIDRVVGPGKAIRLAWTT